MSDALGFEIELSCPYEEAIERVTDALRDQGFGVLTRIDVRATLKEKLGEEFRPYVILGACSPQLAHRALSRRPDVGLLLPCNVTVESAPEGRSLVRIVDPAQLLALGGDPVLHDVATEAQSRLQAVAERLSPAHA